MHLLVGIANDNRTVTFAQALTSTQDSRSFKFVLNSLIESCEGRRPCLIFTDKDAALQNAIDSTLGLGHHMLCVWHIAKAISKHLGASKEFMNRFWSLQRLADEEDFNKQWTLFCNSLPPASQLYLANHITPFQDKWANYARFKLQTLGVQATSRVEGAFSKLKSGKSSSPQELALELHEMNLGKIATRAREEHSRVNLSSVRDAGFLSILNELNNISTRFIALEAISLMQDAVQCYNCVEIAETELGKTSINCEFEVPTDQDLLESIDASASEEDASEKKRAFQVFRDMEQMEYDGPEIKVSNGKFKYFAISRKDLSSKRRHVSFNTETLRYQCSCSELVQRGRPCKHVYCAWAHDSSLILSMFHWCGRWHNDMSRTGEATISLEKIGWKSNDAMPHQIVLRSSLHTAESSSIQVLHTEDDSQFSHVSVDSYRIISTLTRSIALMHQDISSTLDLVRSTNSSAATEFAVIAIGALSKCHETIKAAKNEFLSPDGRVHLRFLPAGGSQAVRNIVRQAGYTTVNREKVAAVAAQGQAEASEPSEMRSSSTSLCQFLVYVFALHALANQDIFFIFYLAAATRKRKASNPSQASQTSTTQRSAGTTWIFFTRSILFQLEIRTDQGSN